MKNYTHLTEQEREEICYYRNIGESYTFISKQIWRSISTIKREIERNKTMLNIWDNNSHKAKKDKTKYQYLPGTAQKKYNERRKDSKQKPYLKTMALYKYIIEQLKKNLSPEIIAWRAKLEGIWEISHECIYQFIYSKSARHLELWKYLPRSHTKRKKKTGRKGKRRLIPNRIGIEERPKSVENRKEFGHWEDDSVLGIGTKSALNTKRERKSRYIIITKIPRKTALNTLLATCEKFQHLPVDAKKTITADNGSEFTKHEEITEKTGILYFFANPYSSWERGTNENGNGIIRRIYPKKTDFNNVSHKQLKEVEDWINNRPLKCLGYRTPKEVFEEELKKCQHTN